MKAPSCLSVALLAVSVVAFAATKSSAVPIFINEIHYDNAGADTGEFVEIAGPAGTDLAGWSLVFYSGSTPTNATQYDALSLGGTIVDQQNGFGTIAFPRAGIQNGASDAIALFDGTNVVQFLSYEGTVTAGNGVATGLDSVDIGVAETSSTPVGSSLQLTGSGSDSSDFTWAAPSADSPGSINESQRFLAAVPDDSSALLLLSLGLMALPLAKKRR